MRRLVSKVQHTASIHAENPCRTWQLILGSPLCINGLLCYQIIKEVCNQIIKEDWEFFHFWCLSKQNKILSIGVPATSNFSSFQLSHHCLPKASIATALYELFMKYLHLNCTIPGYPLFWYVCKRRHMITCLITMCDNCIEVWSVQFVARYFLLLNTTGRFYCCIISVSGKTCQ